MQSQHMSTLLNDQKTLLSDVDQQLEDIKKWRASQKEKERQRDLDNER
jgi:type II secretory pathway component PulM